ncbi:MAG: carbohydrate kinase [Pseudomonadota bacterium]
MYLICGEALFDFFLGSETGPGSAEYAARAGGSPFNVSIGLARQGVEVGLLTGLSTDFLGARLHSVLVEEGVDTRFCQRSARPSTLSLVGLDAQGAPAYQFFDAGSAGRSVSLDDLPPLGAEIWGLHFGSYSMVVEPVADTFAALARREQSRFISLDPNIRPTIEPDMAVWQARLKDLYPHVDVVKISVEDLEVLHPGLDADGYAKATLAAGPQLVVVTDGGAAVRAYTEGFNAQAQPPVVDVIDTVGAGDTFQATLLAMLGSGGDPKGALASLTQARLEEILTRAARAAALTTSRRGADLPTAHDIDA